MRHTPEPWRATTKIGYVYGPDCVVATCGDFQDKELVPFNADRWNADARRIAAAVNACAGIPTEALEADVVKRMRGLLEDALFGNSAEEIEEQPTLRAISDILKETSDA